jgi:23S rRNA (uracil1939-C5)-methyltransferase
MIDQTFQGIVEKIIAQGYGLVRTSEGVVFCPPGTVAPEDKIEFTIQKESKNRLIAKNITILEVASLRVQPLCIYYETCGGCDLMHIGYDHQLNIKQSILVESCIRQGISQESIPPVQVWNSPQWGYRNRIQLQVTSNNSGFFARGSKDLIAIDSCAVAAPELQPIFSELLPSGTYQALGPNHQGKISLVKLFQNQPGNRLNHQVKGYEDTLWLSIAKLEVEIPTGGFFQSNFLGLVELRSRIYSYGQKIQSSPGTHKRAVELYCGQGILGQALPDSFISILGVDSDSTPHYYGPRGKKVVKSVEHFCMSNNSSKHRTFDLLIADPSRNGLSKTVFPWIERHRISHLFLVFCDPVSAARDLARCLSLGYRINTLELLDFYPQTHQFETFCWLELEYDNSD